MLNYTTGKGYENIKTNMSGLKPAGLSSNGSQKSSSKTHHHTNTFETRDGDAYDKNRNTYSGVKSHEETSNDYLKRKYDYGKDEEEKKMEKTSNYNPSSYAPSSSSSNYYNQYYKEKQTTYSKPTFFFYFHFNFSLLF